MEKIAKFFIGVKKEMIKVRWAGKKEMVKYSVAAISIILIFALFFVSTDLIAAGIKTLIK